MCFKLLDSIFPDVQHIVINFLIRSCLILIWFRPKNHRNLCPVCSELNSKNYTIPAELTAISFVISYPLISHFLLKLNRIERAISFMPDTYLLFSLSWSDCHRWGIFLFFSSNLLPKNGIVHNSSKKVQENPQRISPHTKKIESKQTKDLPVILGRIAL